METRANHLWVGVVTLMLLAALAAFIVWLARLGEGARAVAQGGRRAGHGVRAGLAGSGQYLVGDPALEALGRVLGAAQDEGVEPGLVDVVGALRTAEPEVEQAASMEHGKGGAVEEPSEAEAPDTGAQDGEASYAVAAE